MLSEADSLRYLFGNYGSNKRAAAKRRKSANTKSDESAKRLKSKPKQDLKSNNLATGSKSQPYKPDRSSAHKDSTYRPSNSAQSSSRTRLSRLGSRPSILAHSSSISISVNSAESPRPRSAQNPATPSIGTNGLDRQPSRPAGSSTIVVSTTASHSPPPRKSAQ